MNDPYKYDILIKKITDDDEDYFQGTVKQFPDLKVFEETSQAAYDAMIEVIESSLALLSEQGKDLPSVDLSNDEDYSGRVTLRMPKSLHRNVSTASMNEDISLNQYLLTAISFYQGYVESQRKVNVDRWADVHRFRKPSVTVSTYDKITDVFEDVYMPTVNGEVESSIVNGLSILGIGRSKNLLDSLVSLNTNQEDKGHEHFISIPRLQHGD